MVQLHAEVRMLGLGRWKSDQPTFVEVLIGKRDQGLVPAAVVPAQPVRAQSRGQTAIENALESRGFIFGLAVLVVRGGVLLKEGRRRQLLVVPGHNQLPAAIDRHDGVLRTDLRRLVENDEVEVNLLRMQKLAYRERTHEQARLELQEEARDLLEQPPQR